MAVEASGAKQRLVEAVLVVAHRQHYHAAIIAHTVHFKEQLRERGRAALIGGTISVVYSSDGLNFVDKDDAGRFFARFFKEGVHTLHGVVVYVCQIRSGDGDKWHIGAICHGLGNERLSRARRSGEQHAAGYFCTQAGVVVGAL